jgi:hypothetical protein
MKKSEHTTGSRSITQSILQRAGIYRPRHTHAPATNQATAIQSWLRMTCERDRPKCSLSRVVREWREMQGMSRRLGLEDRRSRLSLVNAIQVACLYRIAESLLQWLEEMALPLAVDLRSDRRKSLPSPAMRTLEALRKCRESLSPTSQPLPPNSLAQGISLHDASKI